MILITSNAGIEPQRWTLDGLLVKENKNWRHSRVAVANYTYSNYVKILNLVSYLVLSSKKQIYLVLSGYFFRYYILSWLFFPKFWVILSLSYL